MESILNITDKTKKLVTIMNEICDNYETEVETYSKIVEELENNGWVGPSNVNFVNGSNEYKANLTTIKNNLIAFKGDLASTIDEALGNIGK